MLDNKNIENKLQDADKFAYCEHDSQLFYRVNFTDNQTGKKYQYCALSESRCPYYKAHKQNGYCTNYSTNSKRD